jgi:D-alanyl-D-alanine endopeptidase (penicillin-binding protein 7)
MPSFATRVTRPFLAAATVLAAIALAPAAHAAAPKPAAKKLVKAAPAKREIAVLYRKKNGVQRRVATVYREEPAKLSFGRVFGLHDTTDELDLKSGVALVVDQTTDEVLFSKNPQAVLPIASLTKLMTALVVTEAKLPLDEPIAITEADIDTEKGSRSRLAVGTVLTREQLLHLALMSSENRAAHALGRSYPGGLDRFVQAMNGTAKVLGMRDSAFSEPTGLSSRNQSSARDLATLVKAAYHHPIIRELSTSPEYEVEVGSRQVQFRTTNALVKSPTWEIGLQKTGYISEAGRCLVMQATLAGRKLILVFLDSAGKYSRLGDAERVRKWLVEHSVPALGAVPALPAVAAGARALH